MTKSLKDRLNRYDETLGEGVLSVKEILLGSRSGNLRRHSGRVGAVEDKIKELEGKYLEAVKNGDDKAESFRGGLEQARGMLGVYYEYVNYSGRVGRNTPKEIALTLRTLISGIEERLDNTGSGFGDNYGKINWNDGEPSSIISGRNNIETDQDRFRKNYDKAFAKKDDGTSLEVKVDDNRESKPTDDNGKLEGVKDLETPILRFVEGGKKKGFFDGYVGRVAAAILAGALTLSTIFGIGYNRMNNARAYVNNEVAKTESIGRGLALRTLTESQKQNVKLEQQVAETEQKFEIYKANTNSALQDAEALLIDVNNENGKVERENKKLEAELAGAKKESKTYTDQLIEKERELKTAKTTIRGLTAYKGDVEERLEDVESDLDTARREADSNKAYAEMKGEEVSNLKTENEKLQAKLKRQEEVKNWKQNYGYDDSTKVDSNWTGEVVSARNGSNVIMVTQGQEEQEQGNVLSLEHILEDTGAVSYEKERDMLNFRFAGVDYHLNVPEEGLSLEKTELSKRAAEFLRQMGINDVRYTVTEKKRGNVLTGYNLAVNVGDKTYEYFVGIRRGQEKRESEIRMELAEFVSNLNLSQAVQVEEVAAKPEQTAEEKTEEEQLVEAMAEEGIGTLETGVQVKPAEPGMLPPLVQEKAEEPAKEVFEEVENGRNIFEQFVDVAVENDNEHNVRHSNFVEDLGYSFAHPATNLADNLFGNGGDSTGLDGKVVEDHQESVPETFDRLVIGAFRNDLKPKNKILDLLVNNPVSRVLRAAYGFVGTAGNAGHHIVRETVEIPSNVIRLGNDVPVLKYVTGPVDGTLEVVTSMAAGGLPGAEMSRRVGAVDWERLIDSPGDFFTSLPILNYLAHNDGLSGHPVKTSSTVRKGLETTFYVGDRAAIGLLLAGLGGGGDSIEINGGAGGSTGSIGGGALGMDTETGQDNTETYFFASNSDSKPKTENLGSIDYHFTSGVTDPVAFVRRSFDLNNVKTDEEFGQVVTYHFGELTQDEIDELKIRLQRIKNITGGEGELTNEELARVVKFFNNMDPTKRWDNRRKMFGSLDNRS